MHELLGCSPVALGLDEHVQHLAFRINGPPEVHLSVKITAGFLDGSACEA
ncbi:hypothetical protein GCM10007888_39150 [Methylobacterium oxalidis]|uniref:Uncharacterized protein n=1 Tax=Methylobacterium oxalidis TaxID=944322 RepID=A0ABQ6DN65_9HYPH|nr:hypothetical protein GCM10007888_39150 [Methylobacterium oxalidis]